MLINPFEALRKKSPEKWPNVLIKPRRRPSRIRQVQEGLVTVRTDLYLVLKTATFLLAVFVRLSFYTCSFGSCVYGLGVTGWSWAGSVVFAEKNKQKFRFFVVLLGYFICVRILLLLFLIFQRSL